MNRRVFRFFYALVWPFFNLFHPGKVYGREHIPQGAALLCGNHTRLSDPLYVLYAMGRKNNPFIMAKAELLRIPVLGFLLKKFGVFGVDRGKSDVGAIKEAIRILRGGDKLLMFPEGTRFKDGETQGAKTGAAMLALRTGVPVVPIWMPAKKRWFRPTPVVFGEPYYPQPPAEGRPTPEDYRRVADDMLQRILALEEVSHAGRSR